MKKYALGEMSEESLKFLLWACLQDNLHYSDIIDHAKSEEFKKAVRGDIEENEFLISRIRFELSERKKEG